LALILLGWVRMEVLAILLCIFDVTVMAYVGKQIAAFASLWI